MAYWTWTQMQKGSYYYGFVIIKHRVRTLGDCCVSAIFQTSFGAVFKIFIITTFQFSFLILLWHIISLESLLLKVTMFREFSKKNANVEPAPVPDHFEDEEPHAVGRNKCFMEVKRQIDIRNKIYHEEKVDEWNLLLELSRNINRCKKMRFLEIGKGLTAKIWLF